MGRKYSYTFTLLASCLLLLPSLPVSAEPTTGRIAFIDRAGDLYTIHPNGSNRRKLASGEMLQQVAFSLQPVQQARDFYSWPAWSPDGQRLASFRFEISNGQPTDGLYIFDVPTSRVLHVYKESGLQPIYAYWAPNSRQLGLLFGGRALSLGLWPTSGGRRPQTVARGAPLYFNWRSDGKAVLVHAGGDRESESGHSVSVLNIESGERQLLSGSPSAFGPSSWSFNGRWLAYSSQKKGEEKPSLMIAAGDGSQPESVAFVPDRIALAWSPAQPLLAIATTSFVGDPLFEEIRLFDVASGSMRTLIKDDFAAFFWSPDGTRILYAKRNLDRAHWAWAVVELSDAKPIEVTNFTPSRPQTLVFQYFDQYALSHRLWSPDSRHFTFSGNAGPQPGAARGFGSPAVYVIQAVEGASAQQLSDGHIAFWSPQ